MLIHKPYLSLYNQYKKNRGQAKFLPIIISRNLTSYEVSKIKSDILDWEPVAVIKKEKKNKVSSDKIISKLRRHLSNYKIPKKYFFINHFPKTHYGKLDRKKLEKLVERLNESR